MKAGVVMAETMDDGRPSGEVAARGREEADGEKESSARKERGNEFESEAMSDPEDD